MKTIRDKILNSVNYSKHTGKDGPNFVGHWIHSFDNFQVKAPCNNNDCRVIYNGQEIDRITPDEFSGLLKERKDQAKNSFYKGN